MSSDRNTQLDDGNYNENVGRNVIHAQQVNIVENLVTDKSDVSNKKSTAKKRLAFAIIGSIEEVDQAKLQAIAAALKKMSGDTTIEIVSMEEGSIRLILEGSPEGLEKLKELFESGELTEIEDIPIEYVRFLDTETSDENTKIETDEKSRLIAEIRNQGAKSRNLIFADLSSTNLSGANLMGANLMGANLSCAGLRDANLGGADLSFANLGGADLSFANLRGANLRDANLSDANLSDANLRNANLSGANLSGTNLNGTKINKYINLDSKWRLVWEIVNQGAKSQNLSGADLKGANLSDADLKGANLSDADLRGANLSGADLKGADLKGAKVENTRFRNNLGIKETLKQDLIKRGAIFQDAPGDRSSVLIS